MKRISRMLAALMLSLAIPMPGFAETHVIAQLGNAPLVGQIASTQALQADVASQHQLFRTAASKLGLTASEFHLFAARVAAHELTYVTLPRHLGAMAWANAGNVYVFKNVIIPAGTRGWEVDLQQSSSVLAIFVPNRCGNLSVLRRPLPRLAALPTRVEAAVYTPPPATPAPPLVAAMPAQAAVELPQPTSVPVSPIAALATSPSPVVVAAVHHFSLLPLLLIPIIGWVGFHGGSTPPGIITTPKLPPPGCPSPTPKP